MPSPGSTRPTSSRPSKPTTPQPIPGVPPVLPESRQLVGGRSQPNGLIYAMGGASTAATTKRDMRSTAMTRPRPPRAGRHGPRCWRRGPTWPQPPDPTDSRLCTCRESPGGRAASTTASRRRTFAPNDGVSIEGLDVADILKDLVGKTVGGVDRGGGGGIIIGGHYIPIPPRSPIWAKILRAAQPYLDHGVRQPAVGAACRAAARRPGQALKQPNLGARAVRKQL